MKRRRTQRRSECIRQGHARGQRAQFLQSRVTPKKNIHLPERCANVCFGGRHRKRLFMAATHSVYALHVNTQGGVRVGDSEGGTPVPAKANPKEVDARRMQEARRWPRRLRSTDGP